MKILAFLLIIMVFLSGCITQESSEKEDTLRQTKVEKTEIIFKVSNYNLNEIKINIPHKMTYENVRWNSSTLPFYSKIRDNETLQIIRKAAMTWNEETNNSINFIEVNDSNKAYFIIRYGTAKELNSTETSSTLGEAIVNPIDTGLFNLTLSGEMLYTTSKGECESEVTAIHELGHILGLDHDTYVDSIMYPSIDCKQKITDSIKNTISNLFSIEALPDLSFKNVEARKIGDALSLNFTVWNRGLISSKNVSLDVMFGNSIIKTYDIPSLRPAYGWYIYDEIQISKKITSLSLIIDPSKAERELNKDDNLITLIESY